ncbi:hypothetical protein AB0908_15445 [Enterobacter hormaechei subsp. xiangfangensis]
MIIFIFLIFIAYPFRDLFTVYENLQEKIKVNDRLTLYITQVETGSLSKNRYHIYLFDAKKSPEEFMSNIKNINPVMITDDDKASVAIKNGDIYLRVRGTVYSFTTVGFDVRTHLDSSPY